MTLLAEHRQRLNVALTELLASTVQIEALLQSDMPVSTHIYIDFFERSAACMGQIAGLQEEVVRIFQDQLEKGKGA